MSRGLAAARAAIAHAVIMIVARIVWGVGFGVRIYVKKVSETVFPAVLAVPPTNWQLVLPYGLPVRCDIVGSDCTSRVVGRS